MRSDVTALGIINRVGAVIAMVSIGNGAKAQVEAQIASLGQNVILIFSGSTTASEIRVCHPGRSEAGAEGSPTSYVGHAIGFSCAKHLYEIPRRLRGLGMTRR